MKHKYVTEYASLIELIKQSVLNKNYFYIKQMYLQVSNQNNFLCLSVQTVKNERIIKKIVFLCKLPLRLIRLPLSIVSSSFFLLLLESLFFVSPFLNLHFISSPFWNQHKRASRQHTSPHNFCQTHDLIRQSCIVWHPGISNRNYLCMLL